MNSESILALIGAISISIFVSCFIITPIILYLLTRLIAKFSQSPNNRRGQSWQSINPNPKPICLFDCIYIRLAIPVIIQKQRDK